MQFPRAAGVLLHPTSFPSRYGIGDLGKEAYRFVDFLVAAKQQLWQVLPLGPTGYGDSPYQCFSTFAGNPLLISPDRLVREGYLPPGAIATVPPFPTDKVDFGAVIPYKNGLWQQAFDHFRTHGTLEQWERLAAFCEEQSSWLDDYALFMALKQHYADREDGGVWNHWPDEIALRTPEGVERWTEQLRDDVERHKFLQFLFFEQWLALKRYANERGIQIIGDIPIFVAFDSADVWANPEMYYLQEDGAPSFVAGVPPDYFSETGQRWGNPLYRWERMAAQGYRWWAARLQMCLTQNDIVRIDHFRGFEAYWEIPAEEETAIIGRWVLGPGAALFDALREELGELPIIAEDLGVITPEVEALRDRYGFPGMNILQFAFGSAAENRFLPHNIQAHSVVYTGTHDNDTSRGWYESESEATRDHVRRYLACDGHDVAWDLVRAANASVAALAIVPMQDLLNLPTAARMNYPGRLGGNWQWRYTRAMLADWIAPRLAELAELYGRAPVVPETEDVEETERQSE